MANLNLDEILALFENGERRYENDPSFKAVVDSLKMGLGVYGVLDHVLKERSSLSSAAIGLKTSYNLLHEQYRDLQLEAEEQASLIIELRDNATNRFKVLTTREVYPNELQDLRDKVFKYEKDLAFLKGETS